MDRTVSVLRTIAGIRTQLDHIKVKLGPRASLDEEGLRILHEVNTILLLLTLLTDKRSGPNIPDRPIQLKELSVTVDRTARLVVDFNAFAAAKEAARREAVELDPTKEAMAEALSGPSRVTLVECPACSGCTLCLDLHLVTPVIAMEWRKRNLPKRKKSPHGER